ncbi:MAG: hypothetical protein ACOYL6_16895 [Bacteriovoracaceae bacterium]
MKLKIILCILLTQVSMYSFGQTSDYQKGFDDGAKSVSTALVSKSSKENRENKKYEISISYGPDYKEITQQAMLSKYIDDDNILGLKIGYTNNNTSKYWNHYQSNISLQYKRYVSNSFYLAPEIIYLKTQAKNSEAGSSSPDTSSSGLGAGFRIGNQWHWKNFTLGCDWIGIGQMFAFFKNTQEVNGYATLLNTYVGYSF